MAAFEDVAARGIGAIEIDPRGAADGKVVIMHDEAVDRTTDGMGAVTELSLTKVEALDAPPPAVAGSTLVADPYLILEPQLDALVEMAGGGFGHPHASPPFAKASCASASRWGVMRPCPSRA